MAREKSRGNMDDDDFGFDSVSMSSIYLDTFRARKKKASGDIGSIDMPSDSDISGNNRIRFNMSSESLSWNGVDSNDESLSLDDDFEVQAPVSAPSDYNTASNDSYAAEDDYYAMQDDFDDPDDTYAMPNGLHTVLDEDSYSLHSNSYIEPDNAYSLQDDSTYDSADDLTYSENEPSADSSDFNDDFALDEESDNSGEINEEKNSGRLLPKIVAVLVLCVISCAVLFIYQKAMSGDDEDAFSPVSSDVSSNTTISTTTTTSTTVATTTTTTAPEPVYKTLKEGDSGDDVKKMQERLSQLGYIKKESCTGYYGSYTKKIIKLFQDNADLKITGIADNETLKLLYSEDAPSCY